MRCLSVMLSVLLVIVLVGCVPARGARPPEAYAIPGVSSVQVTAHKEPDALGTFRMVFEFEGGWRPARDVLLVLAPFANKRDREGAYDPGRLFGAAEALVGGLHENDRVNVLGYRDLLQGGSWFPKEFPFVENADDLFVRPAMAFDAWQAPAEAQAGLAALRERGVETLRNTSYLIELLGRAALAFESGDGRVKEIIVVADSHTVPTKGFFDGLPVEVPEIKLEPLDPEWTAALFGRFRSEQVHVNFVAVAADDEPVFRERRLQRMAETTGGFYFEWPGDEAARQCCVEHIATGLYRGLEVDFGASDANYIYTNRWAPNGDTGFVVYGRYGRPGDYTFVLRDTLGGGEWPFAGTFPSESSADAELETAWARQRVLDGVWRLTTYGRDDYLAYDLQQLAHRHGLALPESLRPSPFDKTQEEAGPERPPRGKAPPEPPVLDEETEIPAHSALAELAPYDMVYVRYGRLRSALELLDMGYFYGRDVIQALGLHPDLTLVEEKVQTQMCVRISRRLTRLYEAAVAEAAEVSTGASIGEGLDVCLLARVKMPAAYRLRMRNFRGAALRDYPGTKVRRFKHEGVVVTETLGQHNVVRSYFAMFKHTPRGGTEPQWFAVSGNSWASVRRVLDVHVGKVPSVLANEDFRAFREKLPLLGFTSEKSGERFDEDVFVYFGAPAALALTDRRVLALQQEQKVVASHLRLLRNALASYARERGRLLGGKLLGGAPWPDRIMGDLVEAGYLPGVPAHPGLGAYAFDPDLQVFYSTRYGQLGWLTPMADLADQLGEARCGKPEVGPTAAQLAWDDEVILSRAITRPDPKDLMFAILRELAGKKGSDFSTFRELMQRPGFSVAMKTQLFEFGRGGLGLSKVKIALNVLANKVKGEVKKAIGWQEKEDPFDWAGDEVCVVLDADRADWRTALVDPPLAFGIKVEKEAGAVKALETIAKAPGAVERAVGLVPKVVTMKGWSMAMRREDRPMVVVVRDGRLLAEEPPGEDTALRAFLPEKAHALIRFDSTGGVALAHTAFGLFGPAAEEQAQVTMARFESLYGNRLAPFALDRLPMMREASRPGGSEYFIDPVAGRIASSVYGLPGDFLLCGRVPFGSGIRKALGQRAVAYGAVVLDEDSIEFTGAAPNPGIETWKKKARPGSMALTREVRRLRTTRSLDRLADAVLSSDGYLWRLGLRGFEVDAARFEKRLGRAREGTAASVRAGEALTQHVLAGHPQRYIVTFSEGRYEDVTVLTDLYFVPDMLGEGDDGVARWEQSSLLVGDMPHYAAGDIDMLLGWMGSVHETRPDGPWDVMGKVVGWSVISQGPGAADDLRHFLEKPDADLNWPAETVEFVRGQVKEYLRVLEQE